MNEFEKEPRRDARPRGDSFIKWRICHKGLFIEAIRLI